MANQMLGGHESKEKNINGLGIGWIIVALSKQISDFCFNQIKLYNTMEKHTAQW